MNAETKMPVAFTECVWGICDDIMYRLCEVDSIVKGCGALLQAARGEGGDFCCSEEITALSYLLTTASSKLMEHWRFVDTEMAGLRRQLAEAQKGSVTP